MREITYDKENNILLIKISRNKIVDSQMNEDCILDFDKNGNIVNIEILDVNLKKVKSI